MKHNKFLFDYISGGERCIQMVYAFTRREARILFEAEQIKNARDYKILKIRKFEDK